MQMWLWFAAFLINVLSRHYSFSSIKKSVVSFRKELVFIRMGRSPLCGTGAYIGFGSWTWGFECDFSVTCTDIKGLCASQFYCGLKQINTGFEPKLITVSVRFVQLISEQWVCSCNKGSIQGKKKIIQKHSVICRSGGSCYFSNASPIAN